jgi:phosphinothricin acetyltransferase
MDGILVRPATVDDVDPINDIHGHYALTTAISFDVEPWTRDARLDWLARHPSHGPHRAAVALDSNRDVVGWASSSPFASKLCYATSVECSVFVRDGDGGRGIGRAMYATLFDWLRDEDVHRMYAGVTLPNDASLALHRAFGFEQVAHYHEVGRKFGRYHDVVWLERSA